MGKTITTTRPKRPLASTFKHVPSLRTLLLNKMWDVASKRIASNPEEIKLVDRIGDMPLHLVCDAGAPFQIVQQLLHLHKPALQKRGFCGRLPLHYAAYSKPSVNVIKLLLRHYPKGAAVVDEDGRLPLHLAVTRNAPKQALLALIDAHPRALVTPNKFGSVPYELASNEHIAKLLEEEALKPRMIEQKIELENKLNSVWKDSRQNPVRKAPPPKEKLRNSSSNQRHSGSSTQVVRNRSTNVTSKAGSYAQQQSIQYKRMKAASRKPAVLTATIMNSHQSRKGIPSPTSVMNGVKKYGNIMSNYRESIQIPCPTALAIDSIERHWR